MTDKIRWDVTADGAMLPEGEAKAPGPTNIVRDILIDIAADKIEILKQIEALTDGDRVTVDFGNQAQVHESWTKLNAALVEIRGLAREALGSTTLKG